MVTNKPPAHWCHLPWRAWGSAMGCGKPLTRELWTCGSTGCHFIFSVVDWLTSGKIPLCLNIRIVIEEREFPVRKFINFKISSFLTFFIFWSRNISLNQTNWIIICWFPLIFSAHIDARGKQPVVRIFLIMEQWPRSRNETNGEQIEDKTWRPEVGSIICIV